MSDFSDSTRDLFVRGMTAARVRDYAEARRYLEWVLRLDPTIDRRVDCLYWLAEACPDPAEKRRWLEEALAYNPSDMRCRRSLALLDGKLQAGDIVDPDKVVAAPASASPEKAAADRFICPQCGGRMTYAPDGKSLTCEYCEAKQSLAHTTHNTTTDAGAAENFLIAMATRKGHIHPANQSTFNCQGCGIDFLLPPGQLSITCPYCGSAYVVRSPSSRELIEPHAVLPFQVTAGQARAALKDWFIRLNLPHPEQLQVERPTGFYLPVWSFEMAGQIPWNCEVQVSRDHWEPESGNEMVYHTGVPVPASARLCAECAEELRAYDLKQAVPFDARYLADWPAETYQVNVGDASLEARHWTYEYEKGCVRDRFLRPVRNLSFNSLGITIESFKLVLLPLWLTHYRLNAERFEVVVNAVTGAIRGQRPKNWLARIFK